MTDNKRAGGAVAKMLSVVMGLIGIAAIMITANMQRESEPFGLGDYSDVDVVAMEQSFAESGTDSDLTELLKALCYRVEVLDDETVIADIEFYGTELLDRAKQGSTDLSLLDDEAVMLELLETIRRYGAS